MESNKIELITEIKSLISTDGTAIEINQNYLEYFEIEELEDIKSRLIKNKTEVKEFTKTYVEELYEKFSK